MQFLIGTPELNYSYPMDPWIISIAILRVSDDMDISDSPPISRQRDLNLRLQR